MSVIGLALEEEQEEDTMRFVKAIGGEPPFPLLADVGRKHTKRFEETAAYLLDEEGVVLQVFPMQTYARGNMHAILREIDRVTSAGSD